MLKFNPILATDSYKLSHPPLYPDNVTGMFSYIEPRTGGMDIIIPSGLQMWMQKFLSVQITQEHIYEALAFAKAHGEPFDPKPWQKIVSVYQGYWPVTIMAVPEGTPVPSGHAIVTIECQDPELFWIVSHIETALLRGVWYPTTIASQDYKLKKQLKELYLESGANLDLLPFALHDFGARGVSSAESAEIGGAAHLVNFMGSDNIEGVRAANYYYSDPMSGFSVPASEHSIECSYGGESAEEDAYLSQVLTQYAKQGAIVSIVIDGYNWERAAEKLCTRFKYQITDSGAKVVFRPDSGDMMSIVPRILKMQAKAFGTEIIEVPTKNPYASGGMQYARIKHVGVIQGDGIDHKTAVELIRTVVNHGFTADCVVMGSGGGLLQKVNRDTLKFAQKASAVRKSRKVIGAHGGGIVEEWIPISKNPISDPGKKSKSGRLVLLRSKVMPSQFMTVPEGPTDVEWERVLQLVYCNGIQFNRTTLAQVRERCKV